MKNGLEFLIIRNLKDDSFSVAESAFDGIDDDIYASMASVDWGAEVGEAILVTFLGYLKGLPRELGPDVDGRKILMGGRALE